MAKYKIVGIINLLLGGLQIIYPLFALLFTLPRLTRLYSEFNAEGPSFTTTYLVLGFVIFVGLANLFLGLKLFSKAEGITKKYFKYGLALVIVSFLLMGLFSSIASLSIALPIYNLTSQF